MAGRRTIRIPVKVTVKAQSHSRVQSHTRWQVWNRHGFGSAAWMVRRELISVITTAMSTRSPVMETRSRSAPRKCHTDQLLRTGGPESAQGHPPGTRSGITDSADG